MKLPLSWLREFTTVEAELGELCHRLTVAGLEVEKVEHRGPAFAGVVVARVLKVERHPDADRLTVCEVDAGARGRFAVVCGAPNVKAGMVAPLALVGARLASSGKHDDDGAARAEEARPVEAATIRGVRSEGMLCSERELALSTEHEGIMELEREAPLGAEVAEYLRLADAVLEIWVPPNRGDCLSILGIAREVAALFGGKLKLPKPRALKTTASPAVAVQILAPDLCPRYAALAMERVTVGRAPHWMRQRLELCGMRSLNSLVDVTNYVMLELGQPLHAFDSAKIAEGRIVVRRAGEDREFITLDEQRRRLDSADLLIADGLKPLAIAGVMGGRDSEVSDTTREILLESAYFEPMAIARTARRLGLRSEASYRFERGVDRDGQPRALLRAAELIRKFAGGRESSRLTDVASGAAPRREIRLDMRRMAALLGVDIATREARRRLKSLGARVAGAGRDQLKVAAPTFRADLVEPEDLVEEVARFRGLEEVPAALPTRTRPAPAPDARRSLYKSSRELMMGCGLTEIKTIAFAAPADNRRFPGLNAQAPPIAVLNPLSAELSELRKSLMGGLLAALAFNLNREASAVSAFEIAKVFWRDAAGAPVEAERLSGIGYGDFALGGIGQPALKSQYQTLKGVLESYLGALNVADHVEFIAAEADHAPHLHPGKSAQLLLDGEPLGHLGELHPQEASKLELKEACAVFELDLDKLIAYRSPAKPIVTPPRFPAIRRDLALVLDRDFPAGTVVKTIKRFEAPLLESVELFDVYEGDRIEAGKKSLALSLRYRAQDRTLTDEEVNRAHAEVVEQALARLNAELRQ